MYSYIPKTPADRESYTPPTTPANLDQRYGYMRQSVKMMLEAVRRGDTQLAEQLGERALRECGEAK